MDFVDQAILVLLSVFRVWIFFGILYAGIGIMLGGLPYGKANAWKYFVVFPRKLFR